MPDDQTRPPAAERARAVVLLLLAALAIDAVFAVLLESRSAVSAILLGTFLIAPLALPVPGLLRRDRRAYAWATLCLTPHFVYGLTELVANPTVRAVAAAMLVLSLIVMVALVAYLRLTRPGRSG